jgi:hypothetical protein
MAIAGLHFHEACSLVQQLHEKQQKLFGHPLAHDGGNEEMLQLVYDMPPIVNELMKKIGQLADKK